MRRVANGYDRWIVGICASRGVRLSSMIECQLPQQRVEGRESLFQFLKSPGGLRKLAVRGETFEAVGYLRDGGGTDVGRRSLEAVGRSPEGVGILLVQSRMHVGQQAGGILLEQGCQFR